jgi:DNA gyrase/topoisomerase IV subunit A
MIVRSPVADLRPMGRNTAGVRIINLKEEDVLVGAEIVDASDLELVDGGEAQRIQVDPAEEAAAMAEKAEPEPEEEDELDELDGDALDGDAAEEDDE